MNTEESVDSIVRAKADDRLGLAKVQMASMTVGPFKDWLRGLVNRLPKEELDVLNAALLGVPEFVALVKATYETQMKGSGT